MADAAPLALERLGPLAGRRPVSITSFGPATRFSFRGSPDAAARLGEVFGCMPSLDPCRAVSNGDRAALWLGPDEWLLVAPDEETRLLYATLTSALANEPHSLVDVSHRNTGFELAGDNSPTILNEGCPLDFDDAAFPVGMCTRTVLAKAEVVMWRHAPDRFRLECWRSFAPYVLAFLSQAIENQG